MRCPGASTWPRATMSGRGRTRLLVGPAIWYGGVGEKRATAAVDVEKGAPGCGPPSIAAEATATGALCPEGRAKLLAGVLRALGGRGGKSGTSLERQRRSYNTTR